MPMAKLYNSKTSRVSGITDHAPLTSYMHHFISSTRIPHSLLNAQQITSPFHMPIKHYITSFEVFFVLYLFQLESFILVFHHLVSLFNMDMFLVGVDQDPTRQPMTMD